LFDQGDQSQKQGILRSESYLSSGHVPEEAVGREAEIERIADSLRPLARRRSPDNLLVYGPSGTGKTTCVRHVTQELVSQVSAKSVYINCWQYNTRPSLLTELLIRLGYPAPRKGKPIDELLSKLREWLDKNRGVAVVLDEFDQLSQQTEVIYDFQLLNEEAENSVAVLMISNQNPSRLDLDPRSRSRLHYDTLEFKPYTTSQLTTILETRVRQAFRPGTVSEEVIESIAEQVAEANGDCRKALQLLLQAGRKAERNDQSELSVEYL